MIISNIPTLYAIYRCDNLKLKSVLWSQTSTLSEVIWSLNTTRTLSSFYWMN